VEPAFGASGVLFTVSLRAPLFYQNPYEQTRAEIPSTKQPFQRQPICVCVLGLSAPAGLRLPVSQTRPAHPPAHLALGHHARFAEGTTPDAELRGSVRGRISGNMRLALELGTTPASTRPSCVKFRSRLIAATLRCSCLRP